MDSGGFSIVAQKQTEPAQPNRFSTARASGARMGRRSIDFVSRLRWDRRQAYASLIALAVVLVAISAGLIVYSSSHHNQIYEGVTVAGVNVGGMTKAQARQELAGKLSPYEVQPITLTSDSGSYRVVPADAGLRFDIDATVNRAYDYGRGDALWERVGKWSHALLHGKEVDPVYMVDSATLDAQLTEIAQHVISAPQDAYIQTATGGDPTIVPEVNGVSFDLTATRSLVIQHFASLESGPVAMVLPVAFPTVVASDLQGGLADVQGVVAEAFTVAGPDNRAWTIPTNDLRSIVSFSSREGEVKVDRDAIADMVEGLAASIDRDAIDAAVYVNDQDQILVRDAVDAREVDQKASVDAIESAMLGGRRNAELVVDSTPADIQTATARQAAAEAEQLIADGLRLTWKGGNDALTRRELLAALTVEADPSSSEQIKLGFDTGVLTSVLEPLFDSIDVPAENAKLRLVNGKVTVVQKSKQGNVVDIDKTIAGIIDAALKQESSATIEMMTVKPDYTESGAGSISFPDTLATASTFYGNSSDQRRQNVERAAELENGWLVAPDEVFSFVEQVGGIDQDEGFVVGFGIVADGEGGVTTAPVVGGGVCQVSTTLFQAAFWSGLVIEERYTHPYWISTYGEPPSGMQGLDAMVMVDEATGQALDFKFRNTTGNWIAVTFEANGTNVVAKILGTNPKWTIEVGDPVITDVTQPDPATNYEDSPELPSGQELQVESAAPGFTSSIHRLVTLNGQTISDDTFTGTYSPSQNTILRGTGGG
jgi:vancomycin resistance protein YoaR